MGSGGRSIECSEPVGGNAVVLGKRHIAATDPDGAGGTSSGNPKHVSRLRVTRSAACRRPHQRERRLERGSVAKSLQSLDPHQRLERLPRLQRLECRQERRLATRRRVEPAAGHRDDARGVVASEGFRQRPLRAASAEKCIRVAALLGHAFQQPGRLAANAASSGPDRTALHERIPIIREQLVDQRGRVGPSVPSDETPGPVELPLLHAISRQEHAVVVVGRGIGIVGRVRYEHRPREHDSEHRGSRPRASAARQGESSAPALKDGHCHGITNAWRPTISSDRTTCIQTGVPQDGHIVPSPNLRAGWPSQPHSLPSEQAAACHPLRESRDFQGNTIDSRPHQREKPAPKAWKMAFFQGKMLFLGCIFRPAKSNRRLVRRFEPRFSDGGGDPTALNSDILEDWRWRRSREASR